MEYWTDKGRNIKAPKLGFGTYGLTGRSASAAVKEALKTGFRHIDTAPIYQNEREVGEGIRLSKVPRGEIFLAVKVWRDSLAPEKVLQSAKDSLQRLKTDYADLLLIHWPNLEVPLKDTLSAMEILVKEGQTRFIGLSNFPAADLKTAKRLCPSLVTNQVEFHVLLSQNKTLKALREEGMFLTAYCPLARGEALRLNQVRHIAEKHKKNPAQIALRWLVEQEDVIAVVKSQTPERIKSNFDIFSFELKPEDRKTLQALTRNRRRLVSPPFAPRWDEE